MADGPLIPACDGLCVAIGLTPQANADRVLAAAAAGWQFVNARAIAPAADGQATKALLRLFAQAWRLPRRDLAIVVGSANRNKMVYAAGDSRRFRGRPGAPLVALPGR